MRRPSDLRQNLFVLQPATLYYSIGRMGELPFPPATSLANLRTLFFFRGIDRDRFCGPGTPAVESPNTTVGAFPPESPLTRKSEANDSNYAPSNGVQANVKQCLTLLLHRVKPDHIPFCVFHEGDEAVLADRKLRVFKRPAMLCGPFRLHGAVGAVKVHNRSAAA